MRNTALKIISGDSAESPQADLESPSSSPGETSAKPTLGQSIRNWFRRVTGLRNDVSLKEALEEAIEEHEGQAEVPMDPEEKVMLHNMLSFSDIKVEDIMIPRSDIVAVPYDISLENLKRHFIEERHTRVPVYKDTLDTMLGFLHVKDMLSMISGDKPFDIDAIRRQLLFVPPSMRIMDLLVRMRHAGSHMAIVVDEYGGTDGLVTMEDVIEEIVGDIHDEHDEEEAAERITRTGLNSVEVSGRIPIATLEKELGLNLTPEDKPDEFDTLGGLIFFQLGRIPAKGEKITHLSGARFEVMEADSRRIRRVRLFLS